MIIRFLTVLGLASVPVGAMAQNADETASDLSCYVAETCNSDLCEPLDRQAMVRGSVGGPTLQIIFPRGEMVFEKALIAQAIPPHPHAQYQGEITAAYSALYDGYRFHVSWMTPSPDGDVINLAMSPRVSTDIITLLCPFQDGAEDEAQQ